jgi:antitoxin (DNA-binding transcriptional repressor) of toxin-antitoxin stability system
MDNVQATGEPAVVTKREKPVVKVVSAESEKNGPFGFMNGNSRSSEMSRLR